MNDSSLKMLTEELAAAMWYSMDVHFLTGIEWSYLEPEEQTRFRKTAESVWSQHIDNVTQKVKEHADLEFVQEMVESFEVSEADPLEQVILDISKSIWTLISKQNGQNRRFDILPAYTKNTLLKSVRSSLYPVPDIFYTCRHNAGSNLYHGTKNPAVKVATQSATAPAGMVKLSVNLNPETAKALKDVSDSQNISLTDTIHQAIAILKYFNDEKELGRIIRTMDQNGKKVREITVTN